MRVKDGEVNAHIERSTPQYIDIQVSELDKPSQKACFEEVKTCKKNVRDSKLMKSDVNLREKAPHTLNYFGSHEILTGTLCVHPRSFPSVFATAM